MWNVILKMLKVAGDTVPVTDGNEPDDRLARGTITITENNQQIKIEDTRDVTFQVVSTRTAVDGNDKKHVAYTVLVHPATNSSILGEKSPRSAILERRYTDFLELHSALKQFETLPNFPRKCLTGNFSASVIAERSTAFEHLLTVIATSPLLRVSQPVANFLCPPMTAEKDSDLLENEFRALDAVRGVQDRRHPIVIVALLKLIVCLDKTGQGSRAELFVEEALRRLEAASDADVLKYYVPLLQLSARLRVDRGAEISKISTRLSELRCQGIETARGPNLEQLLP